jgi:Tol biopolymer transport system component
MKKPMARSKTPSTRKGSSIHLRLNAYIFSLCVACLLASCGTSEPASLVPPPASTPGTTVVAGPGPAETRDPFTAFTQSLISDIDSNNDNALRTLIGTPWKSGRYNTQLTEYREPGDAVAAFRAMRQRALVTIDPTLAGTHPTSAPRLGERIVVARWVESAGKEEAAFIYASSVDGGWRWTGLLVGVPAEQVSLQPTASPPSAATATSAAVPKTTATGAPVAAATTSQVPTASPPTGHVSFMRGANVVVRDIAANSNAAQALVLPATATQGDWKRDGTRAVFLAGSGEKTEMWMVNRDGSGLAKVGVLGRYSTPHWSPDGASVLYSFNNPVSGNTNEIWTVSADGTLRRKLADGYDAVWSPDGQRIAFASTPTSSASGQPAKNAIRMINAQGKNEWSPITTDTTSPKFTPLEWQMNDARVVDAPQWSPDGKEVTLRVQNGHGAYVTTDSLNGGFGRFIAVYFDGVAHGFSYSPNGKDIALGSGGQSGYETIVIYHRSDIGKDGISGNPVRTLGRIPKSAGETGQSISSYDWSPDGSRIIYSAENAGIWITEIVSGATTQLSADGAGPVFWLR